MKTRLISFLLLIALVVTAMPLVSFAAENDEPTSLEMTEADYNALYVTDNLLYSLDFYKLNTYWNSNEEHGYVVPKYVAPDTTGLTEEEATEAEKTAKTTFITADKAFFAKFNNTPDSKLSLHTNNSFDADEGILSALSEDLGIGYATIRETAKTARSLILEGADAGEIQTFEMVSKIGTAVNKDFFILNGFEPTGKAYTNGFAITGTVDGSPVVLGEVNTPNGKIRAPMDTVTTVTYTMDKALSLFSMYNGSTELLNATYTGTLGAENYIGYNGWADNTELYAVRYYSDVLTEDERAQNHFADIAKFFKLDVSKFVEKRATLSENQIKEYYAAFADVTVESELVDVMAALATANNPLIEIELESELDYYNGLYVTDGLLYSIDFYKLNEYWRPEGHSYTVPICGDDETADAFILKDKAFFAKFNNTPESSLSFHTANSFDATESTLSAIVSTLGNGGYVTVRNTGVTTRALTLSGAVAGEIQTFEMVSKIPSAAITTVSAGTGDIFVLNSFSPRMRAYSSGTTFTITGTASGSAITLGTVNTPNGKVRAPLGSSVTTITYTMDTVQSLFSMYNGSTELMNATYTGTLGAENYIGYNGVADDTELYALRYYSDVLTEDERAQNHFADIAKFFRLDVSEFVEKRATLSGEQIKAYYAAFAGLTVESELADVMAALDAANAPLLKIDLDYYNSLYVTDNLLYSIDFYKLNEYWNVKVNGVPEYDADIHTSGNLFIDDDEAFFLQFNNTPESSLSFHTYKSFDTTGICSAIESSLGNGGFVTIRETSENKRALILEGATAGQIKTFEMVSKVPDTGSSSNALNAVFVLNGLAPLVREYSNGFSISGTTKDSTLTFGDFTEGTRAPKGEVTTITYVMDGVPSETYGGTFYMYNGSTEVMSAPYTGTLGEDNYIGYKGVADNFPLYAARYYSDVLTDDERAQNHFADLAKFFRLDIEGFDGLGDAEKETIYNALADYSVGENTKEEVQLAYYNAVGEVNLEELITFDGYEAKIKTCPGIRSIYTISKKAIEEIEKLGYKVTVGAIMASETEDRKTPEDVLAPTDELGDYDRTGYGEGYEYVDKTNRAAYLEVYRTGIGTNGAKILTDNADIYEFAHTTVYKKAESQTKAVYEALFLYRGFYVITDGEGNTIAIGYADMTSETFGDSISIYELSKYIKENDYEGHADNDQILKVIEAVEVEVAPEVTPEEGNTEPEA